MIRPEFTDRMKAELSANRHKGDWTQWRPSAADLDKELWHHVQKLRRALADGKQEAVAEHSADVANICMKAHEMTGLK